MNRKLDKMGNAWADFAYDVTLKGQADDEWKDTIEQRIDDQQLTNMEMRIIDQMAEMERSHQKSQEKMQKMQEKIDLLLERRSMDEDSDY
jgi:hypothetical protein